MKPTLIILITLAIILMLTTVVLAQPGLPSFPDPPSQAPIDGGLGILAAAGGAYAMKKLRERKKNNGSVIN